MKQISAMISSLKHSPLTVVLSLSAACLLGVRPPIAAAQVDSRVVVEAPTRVENMHLRIAYGIANTEYREQLLRLTPLGSNYEQVQKFAKTELQSETHPSESVFDPGVIAHQNSLRYIDNETRLFKERTGFSDFRRELLQNEPSHAKVTFSRIGFIEGTEYMNVHFTAKPSVFGSWIEVSAYYLFDAKHQLIDVYCLAGGRHVTGP